MRKKLAIIGASYLQLPLVIKAMEMQIETHCFAWEKGAVCKDVCDFFYPISVLDKQEILKVCERIGIDGITTIATDIAIPTISYIVERLNLIGNTEATAFWATNKGAMRAKFYENNVEIPQYKVVEDSRNLTVDGLRFPLIVKPIDSSGSRGVTKVQRKGNLRDAVERACDESLSKKAVIEEFIAGPEVSVESISWKGEHHILAITDKVTTGEPNYVELAHHQPSLLVPDNIEKVKKMAMKAITSLGITYGGSHTEIKIHNGKAFVLEVGARMGGDFIGSDLVNLSTGYDFLEAVIGVALNRFVKPEIKEKGHSGIYFLCKQTEELISYFNKKNDFDVRKEIQDLDLTFARNSNERSGFLIYKSKRKIDLLKQQVI